MPVAVTNEPFKIKRHDRRPYLPFYLLEPDGVTPLVGLANATSVFIVVGIDSPDQELAAVFKRACVVVNAATGYCEYHWSAVDTVTAGEFIFEFEITWPGGELQTIPQDGYLSLIIYDDLG
jgi:hypothetical protein